METSLGPESESLFRTQEAPTMETWHASSFWPSETPNPVPDAETTGSLDTSPTPSTDPGLSQVAYGSSGAGDGLTTGAVVGIAVGAAIGGLLVGSLLIWLLVRRLIRARQQDGSDARSTPEEERDVASPTSPKEHVTHVARRPASPVYEMDNSTMRQQLDDTGTKGEMDGWSPSVDGDEKFHLGETRDARSPKE